MDWRFAEDEDRDLLAAWNRALQLEEGAVALSERENRARLDRWLAANYSAVVFGGASPAAYALYRPTEPDSEGAGGVYLRQFFVAPHARRAGVGTAAFRCLVEEVVPGRRLVLEVLSTNPTGEAFWRSLGLRHYCSTYELPSSPAD